MTGIPPKFFNTADVAAFRRNAEGGIEILLVERGCKPYAGHPALPGGFVEKEEDLPCAAVRELKEETGLSPAMIHQVGVRGGPGRDPRGRVISTVYLAIAAHDAPPVRGSDDAQSAFWQPAERLPALAFDHGEIAAEALNALRRLCERTQIVFAFLPQKFAAEELSDLLDALRVLNPERAAEEITESAPDVAAALSGRGYRINGNNYLKSLRTPVFAFPPRLTRYL